MSKHHIETITCPNCNHKSNFLVWDSINTVIDPQMKQRVLTGDAFLWKCEKCGYDTDICYSTLYHQMENHIMIYCVYGDKEKAINMMNEINGGLYHQAFPKMKLPDDYIYRIVGSKEELKEKILIFDKNLDDCVIELMKIYLKGILKQDNPELDILTETFFIDKNGKEMFLFSLSNNSIASIDFKQDLYELLDNIFNKKFKNDEELVVDSNWAQTIFSN